MSESGQATMDWRGRLAGLPGVAADQVRLLAAGGPVFVGGLGAIGAPLVRGLAPLGIPLRMNDYGRVEVDNVGLQGYRRSDVGRWKTEVLSESVADFGLGGWETVRRSASQLTARDLQGCRLAVICYDNFQARLDLQHLAVMLDIPLLDVGLDGSGQSLYGRSRLLAPARGTGCLACGWDASNWDALAREEGHDPAGCLARALRQRPANRLEQPSGGEAVPADPPLTLAFPGLAQALSGLAVVQAVRWLLGGGPSLLGCEWQLNLTAGTFRRLRLPLDAHCRLSHRRLPVHWLETCRDLRGLCQAADALVGPSARLHSPGAALVKKSGCPACRRAVEHTSLSFRLPPCPACGGSLVPLAVATTAFFDQSDLKNVLADSCLSIGLPPATSLLASGVRGACYLILP